MSSRPWSDHVGPHRAHQIREGSHDELSNGHKIECTPAGGRHGQAHVLGGAVLASAAGHQQVGIDVGISFNEGKNLRAPDIVVGTDLSKPGWVHEAPPLAVEYAGLGQDEVQLQRKIVELLEFGTRTIWVVRLTGPLRVEVHERGADVRIVDADGELTAPGVLVHPVPVRALIDPDAALEATLQNLLADRGYTSLDEVREISRAQGLAVGRAQGREESLAAARDAVLALLQARGAPSPAISARVAGCTDLTVLLRWLTRVAAGEPVEAALD